MAIGDGRSRLLSETLSVLLEPLIILDEGHKAYSQLAQRTLRT